MENLEVLILFLNSYLNYVNKIEVVVSNVLYLNKLLNKHCKYS
jgi:hypothetical protein